MRRIIALVVLLVVLAVPVAAHTNHVAADTQVSADGKLVIEAIYPADDDWVAVHLDDGNPGTVIGYRRVAGGTFHSDVPVAIENDTWESWPGSRQLHVVLHQHHEHRPRTTARSEPSSTDATSSSTAGTISDLLGPSGGVVGVVAAITVLLALLLWRR